MAILCNINYKIARHHTLLHPVKQVFRNDSRNRIRHNDIPERQFANVPTFLQHRVHAAVGHFGRGFSSNSHCSMGKSMRLPCRASQVGILRLSGKRFEPSIRKKRKIFIPTWVYSCCVRHEENRSESCRIVFPHMDVSRMGYGHCNIIYGQIRQKSLIFFAYL